MKFELYVAEEREKAYIKGYDEGYKEEYDEVYKGGREEVQRLNAALVTALRNEGREGEIADAMFDPRVYERLLEELGIE